MKAGSFQSLVAGILALSDASDWAGAREEWELERIELLEPGEDSDFCICGHEIRELCYLRNAANDNQALVGNICVHHFLGLPTQNLFRSLGRISNEIERSASLDLIDYAHDRGIISDWEYNFSIDTHRKRKLSAKQESIRVRINDRITARLKRPKLRPR